MLHLHLHNQTSPLAGYLTQVVEEKTAPNSPIKLVATELLHGATDNISRATDEIDSLYKRLSPSSPLPFFLKMLDIVELYRYQLFYCVESKMIKISSTKIDGQLPWAYSAHLSSSV